MVVGKPYIHFKVNNEPVEEVVDYNYTWATVVEAKKGPINTPTYISSASQAYSIFGVDMRPYFAQGPQSLIMVRAAASSDTDAPRKGLYQFKSDKEIVIYRAEQLILTSKKVEQTKRKYNNGEYVSTHDDVNDIDVYEHKIKTFEHKMFYVRTENDFIPVVPHRDTNGTLIPDEYIDSWTADGRIITEEDVINAASRPEHQKASLIEGDGLKAEEYDPEDYKQSLIASTIYNSNEVQPFYVPRQYIIPAETVLFEVESKFEGLYGVLITCGIDPSDISGGNGYRIMISQDGHSSIMIRNAQNIHQIVNRINDSDLDIVAKSTIHGDMITSAMQSYSTSIETSGVSVKALNMECDMFGVGVVDEKYPLITSPIVENGFISLSQDSSNGEISYLLKSDAEAIEAYENHTVRPSYNFKSYNDSNGTTLYGEGRVQETNVAPKNGFTQVKVISNSTDQSFVGQVFYIQSNAKTDGETLYQLYSDAGQTPIDIYVKVTSGAPTIQPVDYKINLKVAGEQELIGGSKGPWDDIKDRIATQYQAEAHREGLKTLRRMRLAGVFCMYGEEAIQNEYIKHGDDQDEPEKGMNNNETCKWRTILLGANEDNRTDVASLIKKAQYIDNQYVLFLGQGLIDTGMTGVVSTLSNQEKVNKIGAKSDNHLLPYECTQYIAGLRSKLSYQEAIFGGQGRKRIRSIGDLEIAPLTSYDTEYYWDPNTYTKLNEGGVLTFTEDYGNITLTDGVTTKRSGNEEDEEGVMNILKYAQNAIYDVCLPYIGRNIDADLENSITTAVEKVLEAMKTDDKSLVDTDSYPAYDVTVSLGSRQNQLLGRIYIYAVICPVHAVRQIEVEMTVQ